VTVHHCISVQWQYITVYQYSDSTSQYISTVTVHQGISVQWQYITVYQYSDNTSEYISTVTVHHSISVQWQYIRVYQYSDSTSEYISAVTVHHSISVQLQYISVYQYSDSTSEYISTVKPTWCNFIQFIKIKVLYTFRALLLHTQEVLHKRHLVYCMRVMSVGCTSFTSILVQPTDITRM
jgi:hypothetical protein